MRIARLAILVALASAVALPAGAADGASSAKCKLTISQEEHSGPTYLTSLTVSGTSCAGGLKLVRAFYSCRVASGGVKGYCRRSVLGYHCSEHRSGIPTQFNSTATCVSGRRRVVHSYSQNT